MTLNEWAKEIHENAVAHGWWDTDRPLCEVIALCHSELSEALEEARAGRPALWYDCQVDAYGYNPGAKEPCRKEHCSELQMEFCPNECEYRGKKPEGTAVEMIDCVIRILDWCAKDGVDVDGILAAKHEYNKARPYRHGKLF